MTRPEARFHIRPATVADLDACIALRTASIADYRAPLGLDYAGADPSAGPAVLGHILDTDPDGVVVAEDPDDGSIKGYVAATRRDGRWFLGSLYVRASAQGDGLGKLLLERVMPVDRAVARTTFTDVLQPVSNAMYAGSGIAPRCPLFRVRGVVGGDGPEGSGRPEAVGCEGSRPPQAVLDAIGTVDLVVKGYRNDGDHTFLFGQAASLVILRSSDGSSVGYGYRHSDGRLGPIAVLDPDDLPAAVASLAGPEPDCVVSLWTSGSSGALLAWALDRRLRLVGYPALACWDRPTIDLGRYVPWSLTLP
ncbi:MAG: GNAT family N-acetyltransferase [Chloroflexi bacterium]|nr:GNAT family N-acetyltransferase [Chloroflexota bacterium]